MFNPLAPLDDDEQNTRDPFGRVMPKPEPDHEISNLGNITALNQPVGEQGRNTRPDVAKVETMLGHAGTLDLKQTKGPTGYWGERTREATRAFQKQNGLKVDGQINPGGETIRALAKIAGSALGALTGKPQTHLMAPHPGQAAEAARPGPFVAQDQIDANKAGARIPPLPDDVIASNARMAHALSKRNGIGDFHRFTTDGINTDPAKAIPEFVNLFQQVRKADPKQADELFMKTVQGVAPEHAQELHRQINQASAPAQQPEPHDAGNPSAPKASKQLPENLRGISMDESGQFYDKDGKPIDNPDKNPDLQKAKFAPVVPAPAPGVVPPLGTAQPGSPEYNDKALKNAGDYLQRLARDPAFLETPLGKAMILQGMFKGLIDGQGATPRTDTAPKLPDRVINPPPYEPPVPGQYGTPPSEDQSGDPDRVINPPPFDQPMPGQYGTPPFEDQSDKLPQGMVVDRDIFDGWGTKDVKPVRDGLDGWLQSDEAKALKERRNADPINGRIKPAESYIWKKLKPMRGRDTRTDSKGNIYSFDHGGNQRHRSQIEKFNKKGEHLGAYDSLDGREIHGPDSTKNKKNIDKSALEDPMTGFA